MDKMNEKHHKGNIYIHPLGPPLILSQDKQTRASNNSYILLATKVDIQKIDFGLLLDSGLRPNS